jgi:hypothetical protein
MIGSDVLPDYWIERPPLIVDPMAESAIEEFLERTDDAADVVDATSLLREHDVPPWVFLCGLAKRRPIAFHGTGDAGIELFEPRQPIDFAPFGHQKAVFATSDPIWAMFYAVVDRDRFPITIANGCIVLLQADGHAGVPRYFFSISSGPLRQQPWRTGYLYFLPAEGFVEQPADTYGGHDARVPQLASPVEVAPFARLEVAPDDFPFLAAIRGHEDDGLGEIAEAVMNAAPWPSAD